MDVSEGLQQITTMIEHPFDSLMELDSQDIHLDCAALHLARDAYPQLVVPTYLARLDALSEEVASLRPGLSASLRYQAMHEVLVQRHALRGDQDHYYDPQNSYLNRALDRGLGIPITLSAVWLEVARRLKWPVVGLGLPGHFIIRFDDRERFVLVDPFGNGRTLTVDDCRQMLERRFDGQIDFSPEFLRAVDVRFILARMLNNLRNIYTALGDWERLANVLRRLVALHPADTRHLHELTRLLWQRGQIRTACAHLQRYLRQYPGAGDRWLVQQKLTELEAEIASLN
jgi:regulator of sirC expression with transglutaminase-like and TPR domain